MLAACVHVLLTKTWLVFSPPANLIAPPFRANWPETFTITVAPGVSPVPSSNKT